jgi:hypothetical protein
VKLDEGTNPVLDEKSKGANGEGAGRPKIKS